MAVHHPHPLHLLFFDRGFRHPFSFLQKRSSYRPANLPFLGNINNSAMLNNNGDANESRKRKLKEVEELTRQSHTQEILNIVAPLKSFTAMLTEADSSILTPNVRSQYVQVDHMINTHNENLRRGLAGMWGEHYHAFQCAAEERVAKKLKEKEMEMMEEAHQNEKLEATLLSYREEAQRLLDRNKELEEMVSNYRAEADSLSSRLMAKEQLLMSLRAALHIATSARPYQDRQEEDAESSYVDPEHRPILFSPGYIV